VQPGISPHSGWLILSGYGGLLQAECGRAACGVTSCGQQQPGGDGAGGVGLVTQLAADDPSVPGLGEGLDFQRNPACRSGKLTGYPLEMPDELPPACFPVSRGADRLAFARVGQPVRQIEMLGILWWGRVGDKSSCGPTVTVRHHPFPPGSPIAHLVIPAFEIGRSLTNQLVGMPRFKPGSPHLQDDLRPVSQRMPGRREDPPIHLVLVDNHGDHIEAGRLHVGDHLTGIGDRADIIGHAVDHMNPCRVAEFFLTGQVVRMPHEVQFLAVAREEVRAGGIPAEARIER